jgi:hypothetical protein
MSRNAFSSSLAAPTPIPNGYWFYDMGIPDADWTSIVKYRSGSEDYRAPGGPLSGIFGYRGVNGVFPVGNTGSQLVSFDEITGQARVTQFAEGETVRGDTAAGIRSIEGQPVYLTVNLKNMYPINFASLQSNWGDDGFQKMSVTFFFEDISLETYSKITPPPAINPILGNYNKSLFSKTPNQTEADRLGFANNLKIDVSSD